MTELHERVAVTEEVGKSAHKRIDSVEEENTALRKKVHDLYSKHHTTAGILVGMEGAVKTLTESVVSWVKKTDDNTKEQIKNRTTVIVGLAVAGIMGTGFAGFIVFAGGKILNWW